MTAAGYCPQELEQVAIQLLPPEIIAEIGIVDDAVMKSAADDCRSHAVIEGLAAHPIGILGLAGMRTQHRPRTANATRPHSQHINGGTVAHAAPGYGKNDDDDDVCPGTVKTFATPIASPSAGANLLPERRHNGSGTGTGVFLPAPRHCNGSGTGVFLPPCRRVPYKQKQAAVQKSRQ